MNKLIGNTPMINIRYEYKGKNGNIFAKLEYYNPTGSIKDRVAYYIINEAKKRGELKENMPIVEATSGNTGIALSALGAYYNHPVYIFMPDWVSPERLKIMKMYNANVTLFSKEDGGFIRCIEEAKKFAQKSNGFLANQFSNKDNILAHYETTAVEILNDMKKEIGGFVSGIGTGGTLIGIGKRLKEVDENIKICALEPDKMPLLSQNKIISQHAIEGIGDDFIPELVDRNIIDDIILVEDEDAINMSKIISRKLGIGVGISSGANFIASVLFEEKIDKNVVTIFVDDNKKYLTTSLSEDVDINEKFISNNIKILGYEEVL